MSIRTIMVLSAALLQGITSLAHADTFTGCVTPGGTIIHVAPGDTPRKPCSRNQELIHIEGSALGIDTRCDEAGLCKEVDATDAFTFNNMPILWMNNLTPGLPNLAVGIGALQNVTPGNPLSFNGTSNTAVGYQALYENTSGFNNTAVGGDALLSNTEGDSNVAVGFAALSANTVGITNTALGSEAMRNNTIGNKNVAVGMRALAKNENGASNVAVGDGALSNNVGGEKNIAIGNDALLHNKVGNDNVAIGFGALSSIGAKGGRNNIAIGSKALPKTDDNAENNIAIGFSSGGNLIDGVNNIYIGKSAGPNPSASDESYVIRIGTTIHKKIFIPGILHNQTSTKNYPVEVALSGELTAFTSSRRLKEDILDLGDVSGKVRALRPVGFRPKGHPSREVRDRVVGLIAEEVAEVFPELGIYDKDGTPLSVDFNAVATVALSEVQRLQQLVEKQRSEIALLRAQLPAIAKLAARLERLEASHMQLAAY